MRVAAALGLELGKHEERGFEDGEHKIRPLCNVRNQDVFVIQSLYGDESQSPNDKLCRFLFMLGAIRDASAARVTAVVPYLCYARKDRKTKARDPVTSRYIAQIFESVGIDHFLTMDVHNLAAYQNSFRRATADHLVATKLFGDHFSNTLSDDDKGNLVVASPDVGGIKRAEEFRRHLERRCGHLIASAFLQKRRSGGMVSGSGIIGDVAGKTVIFIDDLISSGGTLSRAAKACREAGAKTVYAAATHGIFIGNAEQVLDEPALEQVIVTDTIPPFRLSKEFINKKLIVVDAANVFAQAVRQMHTGGSIVELLPSD